MKRNQMPAMVAATALFAGAATAQVAVGSEAPEIQVQASYNGAPASFADFRGKLVMIEFFATW